MYSVSLLSLLIIIGDWKTWHGWSY